jgi:hypothetical protein
MLTRPLLVLGAVWIGALVALRLFIVPPEECGDVNATILREDARLAAQWIVNNQNPDGSYTYEYDRDAAQTSADYNIVRHAGVTMSLYQAAGKLQERAFLEAADRSLDWMLDRLRTHEDGWVALADTPRAQIGSSALMLVALADRRLLTNDTQHDDVMKGLGDFLVAMQRDDGGFYIAYQFDQGAPDTVGTSRYYPGEALFGIALLENAFPAEPWDVSAVRAADFIALERDDVEDVRFPPLNDHWASYGFAEMAGWGLNDDHTDYARRLYGRFSLLMAVEAQREAGGLSALTRGPERRAAALGTWVEGLAALWRVSQKDERLADLAEDIKSEAVCGAGILDRRQVHPDEVEPSDGDPALLVGAWFTNGSTRMDDQQHAISGLLYTADALDGRVERAPEPLPP